MALTAKTFPLLLIGLLVTACVTLPDYDVKFDDGLSGLQNDVIEYYDGIALDADGGACTPQAIQAFWSKSDSTLDRLILRADYVPRYGDVSADLKALRTSFDHYHSVQAQDVAAALAAGKTGHALCPPAALAQADARMLSGQIGAIIKLELAYKAGAKK